MSFSELTEEVASSRRGARTAAFFDFDGTLIHGFSIFFFLYRRYLSGKVSRDEVLEQLQAVASYALSHSDFTRLLADFGSGVAGIGDHEMWSLAEDVFSKDLAGRIYPESRALLQAHLDRGHSVVILSAATQYQVMPAASELGVENVICTRLEIDDDLLTGDIAGPVCYGEEKCRMALDWAAEYDIDLDRSFFYSDGAEDIPLLDVIGHPRPLNPDSDLTALAMERNWHIRRFDSRGFPEISDLVRTGLVYGSLVPSLLASVPAFLLNRSKRNAINLGMSIWSDLGSTAAGLETKVTGEKHLWTIRPAVFVFNHQSAADALIITRLLRRDFTGVAKKELKNNPLMGAALKFADMVFVDRSGGADPAMALKPALDKLKNGISIVIAPEGQRSPGYKLGRFKKGAFHIAMQAGVPVVPIVIANASDALPKSAVVVRPATVEVSVLKPIDTSGWNAESIDDHVADCRRLFLLKLGQVDDTD